MKQIQIDENQFKIKFDGQIQQVNVDTLIASLLNVSTIIQTVNSELNTGKKVDVKISTPERGSFIIGVGLFAFAARNLTNLFTKENLDLAKTVLGITVDLFNIKKLLGNEKPDSISTVNGDTTIIKKNYGSITINKPTYNLYFNNQQVQDSISNVFEILRNESEIKKFEITDIKEKPFFEVEQKNFDKMASKFEVDQQKEKKVENATLNILKVVFEPNRKWDFYHNGYKISADIVDQDFFKRIKAGEKFANGDTLEVELTINQVFDPVVNTYVNHSFKITKVINHISRPEQQKLDFKSDES